jgi:hypothetical protein
LCIEEEEQQESGSYTDQEDQEPGSTGAWQLHGQLRIVVDARRGRKLYF